MSRTIINTSNDDVRQVKKITVVTASTAFATQDLGQEVEVATDALVMTLPLISTDNIGREITFRNTGADGAAILTIAPNALDGINGSIANAAADSVASGVVDKDFVNTKASANNGDYVTLRATALTKWTIIAGVGIWASEG